MSYKPSSAKKNKIWSWTAVNHFEPGILAWAIGDHSATTFEAVWVVVGLWQCFFMSLMATRFIPSTSQDGYQVLATGY
jgi:IS1 family transposase